MSETFKLAMELTMIDMLSSVAKNAKNQILGLGDAGKQISKDFDRMTHHLTVGAKAIAASVYAINKLKPGVAAAADMQEELHKVEMNLSNSTDNAAALHKQLQAVKDTANFIGQNSPFSAQQIVGMQAQLLKSGIPFQEVTGKQGVTWNASGLAALSGLDPTMVGDNLAKIGQTFGFKKGEQYSELANWLEKSESSAGHDLGALFYGMKMSGNSAHALGISPKDLVSMLTMAAPLGEMAGTSVNRFIDRLAGGHREERKYLKYMGLDLFDSKTGKFKGVDHTLDEVRTKFGAISNDRNKLVLFEKIFGEEGKRFAEIVTQSKKSFQDWDSFIGSHKNITEKQEIWSQGFNASWIKLVTTVKSTGASLFDPLLAPLTASNDLVNNMTGKLGAFAEEHKNFAKVISYGAGGAAVGAGVYGLVNIFKGVGLLGSILRSLRSLPGTALGALEGKAIQGATGIQPVFVTNFPLSNIPVVGGLVPTSVLLAPVLLAAIAGAVSIAIGQAKTDNDVKSTSTEGLQKLRKQHMVLGGGDKTYQVKAIDKELARRGVKPEGKIDWLGGPEMLSAHEKFKAVAHMPINDTMSTESWKKMVNGSIKNNINLSIHVDGNGRTITKTDSLNTSIDLPRGDFFLKGLAGTY